MSTFKLKRSRRYTEPLSLKVDAETNQLMQYASQNGYDVPENARDALREYFKKIKQEIIIAREIGERDSVA